ncbi:hypothetical protein GCQ56_08195 [Marinifilum sp. N1E240]|uniref:hypothetical protein n=1 Tax=Marinifilum sp. N1E240 TaxID=2608082 RepID=UPI00128C3373|nr:hypothetical protein [Marinifilum sp. N1E240]MPQ46995.1 hypothetical protein [Marinifilum sp. N1E240]
MAVVKKNLVTSGLSGKLGQNLVFRQNGGKTILSSAPQRSGESTSEQIVQQDKFKHATQFAKVQMSIPEMKEEYKQSAKKKGMPSAYNMAVADYFHSPEIGDLNVSNYHGEVGNEIEIIAFDDFKVEHVEVEIYHNDGSLVEKGLANKNGSDNEWHYAATVANAEFSGDKIVVKAFDYPGNEADKELVLQ